MSRNPLGQGPEGNSGPKKGKFLKNSPKFQTISEVQESPFEFTLNKMLYRMEVGGRAKNFGKIPFLNSLGHRDGGLGDDVGTGAKCDGPMSAKRGKR